MHSNSVQPFKNGALNTDVATSLRHVWTYCVQHKTLRVPLIDAFASRLKDIDAEKICAAGCVQRLLQTPEGIDPTFNSALPDPEALREELSRLVSLFDAHWDEQFKVDQHARQALANTGGALSQTGTASGTLTPEFEAQLQLKVQACVRMIESTLANFRGVPRSMLNALIEKPAEDLEKNELMLAGKTLGDLSIQYHDGFGRSALLISITRNQVESVKAQVEKGAPVNAVIGSGGTVLHIAAAQG